MLARCSRIHQNFHIQDFSNTNHLLSDTAVTDNSQRLIIDLGMLHQHMVCKISVIFMFQHLQLLAHGAAKA